MQSSNFANLPTRNWNEEIQPLNKIKGKKKKRKKKRK